MTPVTQPGLAERIRSRGAELLEGLERHLPGSREHADGTASYAFATAVELGLARPSAEAIREAARLHEVGKVYVPAAVLARQPAELGVGDQALLEAYPAYGAQLARGAGLAEAPVAWILATRERFDGGGPARLAGERIPLESRIIRAACACDAEIASAPAAGRRREAIDRLRGEAGRELDPRIVDALATVLERASAPAG